MKPFRPPQATLDSLFAAALLVNVAAVGLIGCEKTIEAERRDVQEARAAAAQAEREAASRKREADREAAEKKAAIDREVARKNAAVAEEMSEARRAEAGDRVGLDEKLRKRFDALDKRLIEMREEVRRLEGPARADADRSLRDVEARREELRGDLERLGEDAEKGADRAAATLDESLDELGRELDDALEKARRTVRKM